MLAKPLCKEESTFSIAEVIVHIVFLFVFYLFSCQRIFMKIEIGENLAYTYLKQIEGCRIAQTNWKTSSQWKITEYDKEQADQYHRATDK